MTTDELNAIVQAVMTELGKAGVDFDFKAETPQADDLVYVMRGTADRYMGITVKWQNLLDIIVQKATEAKNEAVSAKDIALQTLATIQGIESNVSTMKTSVETMKSDVSTMKTSVEASEANVTQMKSDVSTMKASVEGTKTEVEGLKEETAGLLNTKADKTYVDGELAKKVNYTDALSYTDIMNSSDLSGKVASAEALKHIATLDLIWANASPSSEFAGQTLNIDLSAYKIIYITLVGNKVSPNESYTMFIVDKNKGHMAIGWYGAKYSERLIRISNSTIVFGDAKYISSPTSATDNGYLVPFKIYGVK